MEYFHYFYMFMKVVSMLKNESRLASVHFFVRVKVRAPFVLVLNTVPILKKVQLWVEKMVKRWEKKIIVLI